MWKSNEDTAACECLFLCFLFLLLLMFSEKQQKPKRINYLDQYLNPELC